MLGLNYKSLHTKSIAASGTDGLNHYFKVLNLIVLILSIIVTANSLSREAISSLEGLFVKERIFYNWLIVEFPGKIGL